MHAAYSGQHPSPVLVANRDGTTSGVTAASLPTNGMAPELAEQIHIPALIPVSVAHIDAATAKVQGWVEQVGEDQPLDEWKPGSITLKRTLRQLSVARAWSLSLGGLPNFHDLQAFGRVGPIGQYSLLTRPAMLRQLLFEQSNPSFRSYDLGSCHVRILESAAAGLNIKTPLISDFLVNRPQWVDRWVRLTGHARGGTFKEIALSWLTAGSLSASYRTAGASKIGAEGMRQLQHDTATRDLYAECRSTIKTLVKETLRMETDGKDTVLVNAVGSTLQLRANGSKGDFGQRCSFVLTGYEAWIMRLLVKQVQGFTLWPYDSMTCEAVDTGKLEDLVNRKSVV